MNTPLSCLAQRLLALSHNLAYNINNNNINNNNISATKTKPQTSNDVDLSKSRDTGRRY